MRLDEAGPRTWLLAGVAGWALLAWALAVVGMGGRVEPLPASAALLKALPATQEAPPLRLGPIGQYSQITARSLFSRDRQPHPFFLQGEGEKKQAPGFDYVLTGVLITPHLQLAILQKPDATQGPATSTARSVRVELNTAPASHPAWRLVGLDPRSAVFAGPEGKRKLQLRVYDGVGGASPTRVQPAQDTSARAVARPSATTARDPQAAVAQPMHVPIRAADPTEPAAPNLEQPADTQKQVDAIRKRIQSRREQMRRELSGQSAGKKR